MYAIFLTSVLLVLPCGEMQPFLTGSDGSELDFLIRTSGDIISGPFNDYVLQYDDGTPHWITSAGIYRGVHFLTEDFYSSPLSFTLNYSEFWFYHHSTMPWDTDQFYAELWVGLESGTPELLQSCMTAALHYSPVTVDYSPFIPELCSFWVIVNTGMGGNGTPSLILDGFGNFTGEPRSFFSYDMENWEPFTLESLDLEYTSWGMIKGLYR